MKDRERRNVEDGIQEMMRKKCYMRMMMICKSSARVIFPALYLSEETM